MDQEWLSAGWFARKSRLSAKALRLYAEHRILAPDSVDPVNGYRRYSPAQLRDARLVRLLRRSGMPLALVAQVMAVPRVQRPALVVAFRAEVERDHRFRMQLLAHLVQTLDGGKEHYPMFEVKIREVDEQTMLTEQAYVTAAKLRDWIVEAGLRQLHAAEQLGGQAGARLIIYYGEVTEDSDGPVEAALPIDSATAGEASLPTRVEPRHREAYVEVTRAQVRYPDIISAYDALEAWTQATGNVTAGAPREIYTADPSEGPDDEIVASVAYPIADLR